MQVLWTDERPWVHLPDFVQRPVGAIFAARKVLNFAAGREHDQILRPVGVRVGGGECEEFSEPSRKRPIRKDSGALVLEDEQRARGIDQSRVGGAVAVEVGPDELRQACVEGEEGDKKFISSVIPDRAEERLSRPISGGLSCAILSP